MAAILEQITELQNRVEAAALRVPSPNPVLAITLHTLDRFFQGFEDDQLTRMAARAFASKTPRERAMIRKVLIPLISAFKSVSDRVRGQIIPETLSDLSPKESFSAFVARRKARILPRFSGLLNGSAQVGPALFSGAGGFGNFGWSVNDLQTHQIDIAGSGPISIRPKQHITSINPDNVFEYGEAGTLKGFFKRAWMADWKFSVAFIPYGFSNPDQKIFLIPAKAVKVTVVEVNGLTLKFKLPSNWPQPAYTHYAVVVRANHGAENEESNYSDAYVYIPGPKLKEPVITLIEPALPKPGQDILINGENFVESSYPFFDDVDANTIGTKVSITPNGDQASSATVIAKRLSAHQLQLTIPIGMVPGDYFLQVICAAESAGGEIEIASNLRSLELGAHRFVVTFLKMTCENSTPGAGADDIFTVWTIGADSSVGVKQSSEYEDKFDVDREDGDSPVSEPYLPVDGAVFPGPMNAQTKGGEVRVGLALLTQLVETDEDENPAYESALGGVASVAEATAGVLSATGIGAVPGAVAAAVGAIAEAASAIFSGLAGGTDSLGTEERFWTVVDLQKKTNNDVLSFDDELTFFWYESTEYRVAFRVGRLPV